MDLLPPPRKRSVSEDYFVQELTSPPENERVSSYLGSEEQKLVFDSVLLSIWGSQGAYRQARIKASSNSIKKVRSESNLQLQIDEYDQSSPKFSDKKKASQSGGATAESLPEVVPAAVPTEFMVRY